MPLGHAFALSPGRKSHNKHFVNNILFIYFQREGKGGRREGNINVFASHTHLLGTWFATQACALTGIEPVTLWFAGRQALNL